MSSTLGSVFPSRQPCGYSSNQMAANGHGELGGMSAGLGGRPGSKSSVLGMTKAHLVYGLALLLAQPLAEAADPDCTGRDRWPAMGAFVQLKNEGVTDNHKLDHAKTEVWRLASEKIGEDLFRQVHHISFFELSGTTIEVITVSDASSEECSMSGVRVFRLAPRAAR